MEKKALHKKYIKEKGVASIFYSELFNDDEIAFLTKYFNWGLGLVNGDIPPITAEQEDLVIKYHQHIKNNKTPPLRNDKWFSNLKPMQQAWIKYFYVQQLGYRVLDFTVDFDSLNIFESQKVKSSARLIHSKKIAISTEKQKIKLQPVKVKSRKCISCGVSIGFSKNYKCDNCFVPATNKKKPKKGSITTNRMTFNRTKWNDDSYER